MGMTTVKPIALQYREVGSDWEYIPLMGVLKGLSVSQDEPDSTEIEAEFYDSPFDIFYDGNPITMTYELANYDLNELEPLFGGEYDGQIITGHTKPTYEGDTNAYTSEWEWKLDFGRGYACLVISRGLTIGTIKKDADGSLNYSVTITGLVLEIEDGGETYETMYKIVGNDYYYGRVRDDELSQAGYNPKSNGLYEKNQSTGNYFLTIDTSVDSNKAYYRKHGEPLPSPSSTSSSSSS